MILLQPERIMFLWLGVLIGLAIGLLPGIGGLTGFAVLVPFTYTMDPFAAIAMLLGMASVTSTSDTITAVLFGVPGEASAQASILDGHAMAKKGEAGRALSTAYFASLAGGLFGALVLAITIPFIRPVVLGVGTPELLALTVFGIAMVSSLSGNAPLRGIVAACFGILVGMIGTDTMTGEQRWTAGQLYLWDGIPTLPILLGIFALPELCEMAIQRNAEVQTGKYSAKGGMLQGLKDCLNNWFLILRCSSLGAILGAIPGIAGSVTNWVAYGHAIQTEKGADKTFGTGDVRGLIAPESATNAQDGGSLLPTIAFGVPGGAAQAILLGALMVHGIIPGPDMLTKHLDVTYAMVWSVALANIFGAGICILLSSQLAKIASLRYTLILPIIVAIVYVGAFQGSQSWGDLFAMLFFGVVGFSMKLLRWPRAPLILGLVLGVLMERYMAISIMRYSAEWLLRPGVMALLGFSALVLLRPLFREVRHGGIGALIPRGIPSFKPQDLAYLFFIGIAGYMLVEAQRWGFSARIGPTVVATALIGAGSLSLLFLAYSRGAPAVDTSHRGIHMDLANDWSVPTPVVVRRAIIFVGWILGFMASMALIGLIPTVPLFIIGYMRFEGREPWRLCL
ncbi:MAG TPA: tripartite tricarboxylate transporter permease, partial [Devosia sp.]|nr:tripartite tricarboxylate transporter permease [Devosia sp.]